MCVSDSRVPSEPGHFLSDLGGKVDRRCLHSSPGEHSADRHSIKWEYEREIPHLYLFISFCIAFYGSYIGTCEYKLL